MFLSLFLVSCSNSNYEVRIGNLEDKIYSENGGINNLRSDVELLENRISDLESQIIQINNKF